MTKRPILAGLLATVIAIILYLLTSCATLSNANVLPTVMPTAVATSDINKTNEVFWATAPSIPDITTRDCFYHQVAMYMIYYTDKAPYLAYACELADGYEIIYARPGVITSVEKVLLSTQTDVDAYLIRKGYSK